MAPLTMDDNITLNSINEQDLLLINEIRSQLSHELKLVPGYYDESSIMRWIIGWNRQIDQVVPKLRTTLLNISALRLPEQDFSTIQKVVAYCDSISESATYLPGTLIGTDKCGNIVSLQSLGRLDGHGLMKSTMISDLYISRIAESEGVTGILRENEKLTGQQLGTVVIIDLDGLSREGITLVSVKVISIMLTQLQEMFPDVLRKVLIIRAPSWISAIWTFISPVLAKQTQQKIEFLGSDWKEKLQVYIDSEVLFEHWGGTRHSASPYGNIRMGGEVPKKLYYSIENETIDLSDTQTLNVPARNKTFIEIEVTNDNSKLGWWWQCASGDLDFWVVKCDSRDGTEQLVWPKFRLLTSFVPERREIQLDQAGIYRLYWDNSHGKLWSKTIKHKNWQSSDQQSVSSEQ